MSGCILHLSISHSPVFLLNSCLDLFSAPRLRGDPLFRSYGVSLPSSLTVNLSSASVSSTRPPVSVCGTGPSEMCLADFLGSLITIAIRSPRRARGTVPSQHGPRICLRSVYLRGSTHYSVSARMCHCSVSTSLPDGVRDCLPYVHRLRLAAPA